MRLRNSLVIPEDIFGSEENVLSVLKQTISKDMDEQVKLNHKVVEYWTEQIERFVWLCCDTMWKGQKTRRLKSDFFARKKEDENFQQFAYVKYKPEEDLYLFDVRVLYIVKILLINPFVMSYKKLIATIYFLSVFFPLESWWIGT